MSPDEPDEPSAAEESPDESSSEADAESSVEASGEANAEAGGEAAGEAADEGAPSPPPRIIVRPRQPEQPVSRIIGDMDPESARTLSASVTTAITAQGRAAAFESLAEPPAPLRPPPVIPPLPAARRDPPPTRVDTRAFDDRDEG